MKRKILLTVLLYVFVIAVSFGLISCNKGALYERLETPQNLTVEEKMLSWDKVEGAAGYTVFIDGKEYETDKNELFLHFLDAGVEYDIKVVANGDGKTLMSSDAATIAVTLSGQIKHGFDGKMFEYTLMKDGTGYEFSRGRADLRGHITVPEYYEGLPVKRIAKRAFFYDGLKDFSTGKNCNTVTTGITLSDKVEEIGMWAFSSMLRLFEIDIPDSVKTIEACAFMDCLYLRRVKLPNGIKEISDSCFEGTSALREINIPDSVETIRDRAFNAIFKLKSFKDEATEVIIPDSVRSIGMWAFYGRERLKDVTMSKNIEWLGSDAFEYTAWYESQPEGFVYLGDVLYKYKGEMPENYELNIPSSVKKIGGGAFRNQNNLKSVSIADGVKLISDRIFFGCHNLTEVTLPKDLESIPDDTFFATDNLRHIYLPETVTDIGYGAFVDSGIEEIIIPQNVNTIKQIFYESNLKKIVLPDGLQVIEEYAFQYSSLTELVIPDGVKTIGRGAIMNCDELKTVVIPREFEKYNLANNGTLNVYYKGSSSELAEYISSEKLIVRTNKATTVYAYSETEPQEEGNFWHYVNGEIVVW